MSAPTEFHILKVEKKPSKINHVFWYVFFKGDDGKSYRTCLDPANRNFKNWQHIVEPGNVLGGIRLKLYKGRPIIDADSTPKVIRFMDLVKPEPEALPVAKPEPEQAAMFDVPPTKQRIL